MIEPSSKPLTYTQSVTEPNPHDADLEIQLPGPVQIVPGEATVYTLTVHNHGPDPATGIVITDELPNGLSPLWARPAEPVCERLERTVGCDVGDMQGGDTATVTLDVSVGRTEPVITGTRLAGVNVDLSVPTCAISHDAARPRVDCRLTRLQPGAEARVRIAVDVDARLAGTRNHTATVQANEADADLSNNAATFTMNVESLALAGGSARDGPVDATAVPTPADLVIQADGPSSIIAGRPFTYTYTITNRGALVASDVRFEDALPPDLSLISCAPHLPRCSQRGDAFTCSLRDSDSGETVTFTLVITGRAGQLLAMDVDPLQPGWPICYVVKERTWLHVVRCELGSLQPGQESRVQLVLSAVGEQERTTTNTASVSAGEADPNPADNSISTTITVQAPVEP